MTNVTVDWLLPVTLFWFVAAIYYGGLEMEIKGGTGFRQFIGLILHFVLFLVLWRVVYRVLGPDSARSMLFASIVCILAMPLEAMLAFLVVGGKVHRSLAH